MFLKFQKYSILTKVRPLSLSTLTSPPSCCLLYQVATDILGFQLKGSLVKHIHVIYDSYIFIDICPIVGIASRNTSNSTLPTSPGLGHTDAQVPEVTL